MVQDMLDTLRAEHTPEGTVRQYKSEWNAHMADGIGTVHCREAATWHYRQVFSRLLQKKASQQVMRPVARTLGTVIDFGEDNGYFGTEEPFGSATRRTRIAEKYRKRARIAGAEDTKRITLDVCPSTADIDEYAAAFEKEYPGCGARLVWLAFATGLRFCELLAQRWDSIDLVTLDVAVDWQLDRYGSWPDLKPPKNGKRRTARLWRHYFDVAAGLVADALAREGGEHGWLFPRHRSVTKWADQAGHLATAAAESCDWN
jgi:integrase